LKIGVYGGTFNPPHIGHVRSATAAALQLGLDLLIIVPAGIPPHKTMPDGTPPAQIRFDMTRVAFEGAGNVTVSDIEIKKSGTNYTIDTVMEIKKSNPGAELYLLTGTDMYLTLESWRDSKALLKAVTPAVFSRGLGDIKRITEFSRLIKKRYGVSTVTVRNDAVDISSSRIREMLPVREGAGYIADTNYSYIIKHRLYNAKPDWDWLRARSYSMLDPERVPHAEGCEHEAIRLAKRWGADPDDAREAAILHDITKKLSPMENTMILDKHGQKTGSFEHAGEKLLHAKTGAIIARTEFGVSEEVADAILWHTTGRAHMSILEKIIYLADYIEPERDFEGVEALRALAYEDLDRAMVLGLETSISDMKARGITPDRASFDALSDLMA